MSFKTVAIKGGLVTGGLIVSYAVFSEMIYNMRGDTATSNLQNLVLALGLYFTIAEFKKGNQGLLKMKEAIKLGMSASLISGIIFGVYSWWYTKFYNPEALQLVLKQLRISLEMQQLEKTKFEEVMGIFKQIVTPEFLIFSAIFSCCLAGIFISILLGVFMKKNSSDLSYSDYQE